jgi:hypothetical protein
MCNFGEIWTNRLWDSDMGWKHLITLGDIALRCWKIEYRFHLSSSVDKLKVEEINGAFLLLENPSQCYCKSTVVSDGFLHMCHEFFRVDAV